MASTPAFVRKISPRYGVAVRLGPLIRRIVAHNPGPFTYTGSGTYIVGRGHVAIIDPGPPIDAHIDAILAALTGETVSHILVTHTHIDHSGAADALKSATGAPTAGFGPHGSGRAEGGGDPADPAVPVEEGVDRDFRPDIALRDGDAIDGDGWSLRALWTPGHCSNHLCFALDAERAVFTGDHIMGWSTSVVVPPDGDMAAYLSSLERIAIRDDAVLWPTHGPPILKPKRYVESLIAHRQHREAQIVACLAAGKTTIEQIVDTLYAEVPKTLHAAAAQSVLAHLRLLEDCGRVDRVGPPDTTADFRLMSDL